MRTKYDQNERAQQRASALLTMAMLLLSVGILAQSQLGQQMASAADVCQDLQVSSVKASGVEGKNVPENTLDGDLRNRWSAYGVGSWISYDLESSQTVCFVDIDWYKGQDRMYNLVISASQDGTSYTEVFNGKSTATTSLFERYDFADVSARHVKLTINGNNNNQWASVSEVKIYGTSGDVIPAPGGGSADTIAPAIIAPPDKVVTATGALTPVVLGSASVSDAVDLTPTITNNAPVLGFALGQTQVTWTATDDSGNTATDIQMVIVNSIVMPPTSGSYEEFSILDVKASSSDGNVPENTLDNNLSTRWSSYGMGSWITLELSKSVPVQNVSIAWYNGDHRVNDFVIATSIDGTTFTNVFSGESSGASTAREGYDTNDKTAKYVRVTVTGNSQSNWASITEIEVNGEQDYKPEPEPIPTPTPIPTQDSTLPSISISNPSNGQSFSAGTTSVTVSGTASDNIGVVLVEKSINGGPYSPTSGTTSWSFATSGLTNGQSYTATVRAKDANGNTKTSMVSFSVQSPAPIPPPSGGSEGTDKFGVKMLYPTKTTGEQWFMEMTNPEGDSRFDPKEDISKNADGSWKIKSSQVRMNVFTSSGYQPDKITTYAQSQLATKGYMQSPNDWKNVEITGFVKVNSASEDNFAWYGRGGKHTDSNGGCEGTAYKIGLYYSGKVRFAKEQQHADGYSFTASKTGTPSVMDRWVGLKGVMYNNAQGNVVLETWISEGDGVTWKKVNSHIDSGGWGSDGDMCGASTPDQKITWGGPIVTFRWDSAPDVDFKWLSVREIQPPT